MYIYIYVYIYMYVHTCYRSEQHAGPKCTRFSSLGVGNSGKHVLRNGASHFFWPTSHSGWMSVHFCCEFMRHIHDMVEQHQKAGLKIMISASYARNRSTWGSVENLDMFTKTEIRPIENVQQFHWTMLSSTWFSRMQETHGNSTFDGKNYGVLIDFCLSQSIDIEIPLTLKFRSPYRSISGGLNHTPQVKP